MNRDIFEYTEVDCSDEYIMAPVNWSWREALNRFEDDVIIEKMVFSPGINKIRVSYHPRGNEHGQEIFNIEDAPVKFLWQLWQTNVRPLKMALRSYVLGSNIKHKHVGRRTKSGGLSKREHDWINELVMSEN